VPKVVFQAKVPSDIDVSQSVTPLPIAAIAKKAGIRQDELFPCVPCCPTAQHTHRIPLSAQQKKNSRLGIGCGLIGA